MKTLQYTLILIVVVILAGGCASSERDSFISKMIAKEEEKYRIWFFLDNTDFGSGDFPQRVKEVTEFETSGKIEGMTFNRIDAEGIADYKRVFQITKTPTILVFDNTGLVLRTTNLEVLRGFLFPRKQINNSGNVVSKGEE